LSKLYSLSAQCENTRLRNYLSGQHKYQYKQLSAAKIPQQRTP